MHGQLSLWASLLLLLFVNVAGPCVVYTVSCMPTKLCREGVGCSCSDDVLPGVTCPSQGSSCVPASLPCRWQMSDVDAFKLVSRMLSTEAHHIAPMSQGNSSELTQNVRLLRDTTRTDVRRA